MAATFITDIMITTLILIALLAKDIVTFSKPLTTTRSFRRSLVVSWDVDPNSSGHLPSLQLGSQKPAAGGTILLEPILFTPHSVAKRLIADEDRCIPVRAKYGVTSQVPILEHYSYCVNNYRVGVVCNFVGQSGAVNEGQTEYDCPALHSRCLQRGDLPYSEAGCVDPAKVAEEEVEISDDESTGSSASTDSLVTFHVRSKAGLQQDTTALVRAWMADTGEPLGFGTTTFYTSTPDRTETQVVNTTGVYSAQSKPARIGPGDGFDVSIEPPSTFPATLATVATVVFEIALLCVP